MNERLKDSQVIKPSETIMPKTGHIVRITPYDKELSPRQHCLQPQAIMQAFGTTEPDLTAPVYIYFRTQREAKAALLRYQLFLAALSGIASDGNASVYKCGSTSLGVKQWKKA